MRNVLTYGDISSSDYDIFIGQETIYNVPERAVEVVSVPGRNGALTIDQGHYENVSIEYYCFVDGQTEAEMHAKYNAYKNAIASVVGYQKIVDSYYPNEYRLGLFIEGIEADSVALGTGLEFRLIFNCKPQRYLTSGDNEITVTNGMVLNNPTLYDSEPLLMVEGYGEIGFNGYNINIEDATLGDAYPMNNSSNTYWTRTGTIEAHTVSLSDLFESGDSMNFNAKVKFELGTDSTITKSGYTKKYYLYSSDATFSSNSGIAVSSMFHSAINTNGVQFILNLDNFAFTKGTSETLRCNATYHGIARADTYGGSSGSSSAGIVWWEINEMQYDVEVTLSFIYNGDSIITLVGTYAIALYSATGEDADLLDANPPSVDVSYIEETFSDVVSTSTMSVLGDPTYIDCEIGEAYMYKDGQLISLNAHIDLGSDLPKLSKGINEFSIDNTITSLKVVPRFWQL